MIKKKALYTLFLCVLLIPIFSQNSSTVSSNMEFSENREQINDVPVEKEWTFMVYLDGDNNLEAAAIDDLNEMEAAGGSTVDVNIIVLIDLCEADTSADVEYGVTWTDARYYYVESGTDSEVIESTLISEEGELNMGRKETLSNFIDFVMTNYPAKRYGLSLWDHGGGLDGICWDEDNNYNNIGINELQEALEGYHFDFLGMDACIMGQYEILYEVSPFADYVGLSLLNEPGDGWDYENFLPYLLADPYMTGDVLGVHICQTYVDQYSSGVTFAIWNTTDMTNVQTEMEDLALTLMDNLDTHADEIGEARRLSDSDDYPHYGADLYEFVVNLQGSTSVDIVNQAADTQAALEDINIMSYSTFIEHPFGLWIYYPMIPNEEYNQYYANSAEQYVDFIPNPYYGIDFVINSSWDDFIYAWRDSLPYALESIDDGDLLSVTTPMNEYFTVNSVLGDKVIVDLEAIDFGDADIEIYDAIGRIIAYDFSSDNPKHIEYDCLTNASYIGVFPNGFQLSYNYEIAIEIDSRPYIKEIYTNPESPGYGEEVEFFAEILDGHGLDEVTLSHLISGTWSDVAMVEVEEGLFLATVTFDESVETLQYKITATDTLTNTITSSTKNLNFHEVVLPEITSIKFDPKNPKSGEEVVITIKVTDDTGIDKVIFSYDIGEGKTNESIFNDDQEEYIFTIMIPENVTTLEYEVYVYDTWGNCLIYEGEIVEIDKVPISSSAVILSIAILGMISVILKRRKRG